VTVPGDSGVFVLALVLLYLAIFLIFGVALRPNSGIPMSRRRPDVPSPDLAADKLTDQAVGALNNGPQEARTGPA
jgi:tight adherence protein B